MGAVIAGGRGVRLGGAKAAAPLAGRPLVAWPLAALGAVCDRIVVVAQPDTPLPALDVAVWREPAGDHHPRRGLVHALERAGGEPVLALAVDLPLVPAALLRAIAAAGARAGAAHAAGQPLCAYLGPQALPVLRAAPADEPLRASIARLAPAVLAAPPGALLNVNTPAELRAAEALIAGR